MRYQRKLWSVDLPEGWTYHEAGHSVAFFNPDGVGVFHISTHEKREPVTDFDLREFAGSARLTEVNAGNTSGFGSRQIQGNKFWMKWWLRCANVMVLATYTCDVEEQGTEEDQIGHLLASIDLA